MRFDFSENKPVITVTLRHTDKTIEYAISNLGPPLPEKWQQPAFWFNGYQSVKIRTAIKTHLGLVYILLKIDC